MAAEIILGIAPLAIQIYKVLDEYPDGLRERVADTEGARAQVKTLEHWLQYANTEIIAKVPLDRQTQESVHANAILARREMEKIKEFLQRYTFTSDAPQSRKARAMKHARELFYPFQREDLKKLQQQLEKLNVQVDRALKPFEHQFQEQFHLRTDASLAQITELIQGLEVPKTQASDPFITEIAVPESDPGIPRALTPEETECLQTLRLTQGDRDASYEWYKDRVDERVAETCQWFLGHKNYQTWLHQRSGPLLVTADPGCGKSVLAKFLIDHELPRNATICYFFFKDQDQNKITQALCAVLHQLFSARPDLLQHARAAMAQNGKGLVHVTAELRSIFQAAVRDPKASDTIFVFDALDECDPIDLKVLVDVMNRAFRDAPSDFKVKCLMTSRPYEQVSGEFHYLVDKFPQIHIPGEQESETIREEVERVIQARVISLTKKQKLTAKLQMHLMTRLLEIPHRTYLWVYLVFEYLEAKRFRKTEKGLDEAIRTLPHSVNDAYEKILARSDEDDFVRKALSFIVAAIRPLTVTELNVALHVDIEHTSNSDLDLEDDSEFESRLRQCCGLFLNINHGKVYLLHQTAREFLLVRLPSTHKSSLSQVRPASIDSNPRKWQNSILLEDANLVVAEACIAFLRNLDPMVFSLEPSGMGEEEVDRLRRAHSENIEFLDYSVHKWDEHVRRAQNSPAFSSLIETLAFGIGQSKTYWNMVRFSRTGDRTQYRVADFAYSKYQIHLAAALDHPKIVEYLVGCGASVNARPGDRLDPPLRHASMAGSYETVRLLLKAGADVNAIADENTLGRTALFPTTTWADEDIIEVLLEFGADPNQRDRNGQTPLFFAKTEQMALQFLKAGAEVDPVDFYGATPLFRATTVKYESVLLTLLQWGADPNIRTTNGSTALFEASMAGWWEGFEILLRNGADINAVGQDNKSTIWSSVAELALSKPSGTLGLPLPPHLLPLIQSKLQADPSTIPETTPLHIAAYHGLVDSLDQLLKAGACVDARDKGRATPLIMAASGKSRDATSMALLLQSGADPNAASLVITALLAAVHHEWDEGVRLLLSSGADPNMECEWAGPPALHIAASYGLEDILKTLIHHGANVNMTDRQGSSALRLAKEMGEDMMVELLRAAGAEDERQEEV